MRKTSTASRPVDSSVEPGNDGIDSDSDQKLSDLDQALSREDQSASGADQRRSDSDQAAADRDQKSADEEHVGDVPGTPADASYQRRREGRAKSEADRETSTAKRQLSALQRASAGLERDESARVRDRIADARDKAADARDREEAMADRILREEAGPDDAELAAALESKRELRERSAAFRRRAAEDRARAAVDRLTAAEEHHLARVELQRSQMDALTGAFMRDLGLLTLEHEMIRARRSGEDFVVAFVDVDNLKQFNDGKGHAAGDELLKTVVEVLRHQLRAYDPVVRVGGDEFICGLVSTDLETARKRAMDIVAAVDEVAASSVTIGLASMEPEDSLDALVSRADADMYRHKEERSRT